MTPTTPDDDEKILNSVKEILRDKSKRISELAELTGARYRRLEKLLTPEKGFTIGKMGWVSFGEND